MGKKKQRPSSSRLNPPPPSTTTASASETPHPQPQRPPPAESSLYPVIFREGSKVQEEMKRGNYEKALQIVRKSISSHKRSPYLMYLEAVVLQLLAKTKARDSKEMVRYLKDASDSVGFAVHSLPPLLNDKDWGEATQECKSLLNLKIENVTDPGVDMFLEENEKANSSKDSRIEYEKQVITQYLQLCEEEQKRVEKVVKERVEKTSGTLQEIKKEFETEIKNWRAMKQVKTHYGMEKYYEVYDVKRVEYKSFWNTLSAEKKRDFFKVSLEELQRHWTSINVHLAGKEAIDFAKEHKTWMCWECCDCRLKFGDLGLYRKHSREFHWRNLDGVELEFQIPGKVIAFIENGEWKPLDAEYWVDKILSKIESESFSSSNCDLFDEQTLNESLQDLIGCETNENELAERVMILKGIRGMLRLFLLHNCLAKTYLDWAIQFTVEEFEDLIPFSQRLGVEAIQIICLLRATELRQVQRFFQKLTDIIGKLINPKLVSLIDDNLSCVQVFDINEKVEIGEVLTSRLLDERFLRGDEICLSNDSGNVKDEILLHSDELLSWLCEGATIPIALKACLSLKDSQKQKSKEIFQIFRKEYSQDEQLYDSKLCSATRITLKAIEAVESIRPKEIEEGDKSIAESYFRLLKKREKELDGMFDIPCMIERSLISNVLEDILNRAKHLASLSSQRTESESLSEADELKMLEDLEFGEDLVRITLQRNRIKSLEDLAFVKARLSSDVCAIMQHELKLEKVSLYDYRSIILPLLKSFLQANLEHLKYEYTAAALASEIDDSNISRKGCDNAPENQDKKKKKKKKKNISDKDKKSKATDSNEPVQLHQKDVEQADKPDSELGVTARVEDLQESMLNESKLLDKRLEELRKIENEFAEKRRSQAEAENVEGLNLDSSDKVTKTADELETAKAVKNECGQEEVPEKNEGEQEEVSEKNEGEQEEASEKNGGEREKASEKNGGEREEASEKNGSEQEEAPERNKGKQKEAPDRSEVEQEEVSERNEAEQEEVSERDEGEQGEVSERDEGEQEEVSEKNESEQEEASEKNEGEQEEAPDRNEGEQEVAPEKSECEQEEAPERNEGEQEEAPEKCEGEQEGAPEKGEGEQEGAPERSEVEQEEVSERTEGEQEEVSEKNEGEQEEVSERDEGEQEEVSERDEGEQEVVSEKNVAEQEKVSEKNEGEQEEVIEIKMEDLD
ncbi:neurofilament medium polypeptide-like [Mangifera indica]|uniref:neurofilament medium polypeptide-like n=1 Tax=Mangifera indica TaxID=29780 RepID=UPI001CF9680A|nr:neurofilament medium polypeptide-like [Mangifera indica]